MLISLGPGLLSVGLQFGLAFSLARACDHSRHQHLAPWRYRLRQNSAVSSVLQGWVIMYAVSQFVFGFGIGGEYPMTSTRATDESEAGRKRGQRHRGRKVMLAYTMQASDACPIQALVVNNIVQPLWPDQGGTG